ncbi:MAG: hypothetical protein KatS3mg034_0195 [Vicingaceae bacterium]|nr:MAG: hypothetical protein KatS3mg034_0195 [Vicingaceae bacterium]
MRKLFYFLTLFILFYFDLDAQTTVSFGCTGSPQTWTVPPCVTSINVVVAGAKGGGANGGPGAVVSATLNVTPGQVLQINVGCTGNCPGGGWNGGGSGGTASGISNYGCGGGGASDIRIAPYGLGNRLIVAGGGGGMGGGDTDANGGSGGCPNGTGGTSPFGQGGSGATTTSGGSGGPPWISSGNWGQNGSLGQGGNGATDPCYNLGPGGGGGGGYYGGGGGGSDCFGSYPLGGGGGGGGSSLIPAGGTCNSNNYGNGYVQITYTQNLPTVSITPSNPAICAGQSVTLTANVSPSGGTFSWSPGGQTTQSITVSPASTTTYTVTYNLNGCVTTSSTTITVNPLPSPTASSNSPICAGQTLNLSATGGVSYSWTGPNGFSSNSQNPAIPNASTAASGTYTVTVTDANGCSNTATTNVTVNPLPNPTASSNSPICAGQTLNLSATGGVSYSWSGPNGFSSNSQNPSIPNASTAASGTYTVTVTNANGCSNSATTNVTINPLPNPTASSNSPICAGQTLNLSATGGVSYSWTGPNGFSSNSQNPSIPNASTAASGTYTVTVTGSNGCVNSATTNVTVNPLPNPNPSSNSPICAGQTLNLNSAAGMSSYSWSGPNGFSANSQNPAIPNASTAASGTYTVTVTDANGCSNTATTNVTVNPLPNPTASSNSPICAGQTLNLSATGGVSYSWSGPNGFSSNSQNPSIPNASTAASGTYTVTVTDANGCSNTATTNVTVNPLPNPTASSNSPICSGQTLNLSATGGVSYSWTGPNGFLF